MTKPSAGCWPPPSIFDHGFNKPCMQEATHQLILLEDTSQVSAWRIRLLSGDISAVAATTAASAISNHCCYSINGCFKASTGAATSAPAGQQYLQKQRQWLPLQPQVLRFYKSRRCCRATASVINNSIRDSGSSSSSSDSSSMQLQKGAHLDFLV